MTTAAIASLLGIILLLLRQWQSGQLKRDQEARNAEIQQGRAAVVAGDWTAVEQRIDKLLDASDPPAGDRTAKQPSAEDVERRLSQL